jgi:hypothetical protein
MSMAKQTVVVLTDDLTGKELPDNGGETVTFSLDGTTYEIDLSHENSRIMREMLRTYVERGRRLGLGHPHTRRRSNTGNYREAKVIREWAVSKGLLQEGSRGRIPFDVREAYKNRSATERVLDDAAKVSPLPSVEARFAEPETRRQRRVTTDT